MRERAAMAPLRFFNLHLPDDVRVFTVPCEGIRMLDDGVVVYDVGVAGGLVLRHYAFADLWFEVNCTLDRAGRPAGTWPFNCDVCTPILRDAGGVYSVDLEIDVLVAADGRRHLVQDEDRFLAAVQAGWISRRETRGALAGLAQLQALATRGDLPAFLERVCPLVPFPPTAIQPPPEHVTPDQLPQLGRARRRQGGG